MIFFKKTLGLVCVLNSLLASFSATKTLSAHVSATMTFVQDGSNGGYSLNGNLNALTDLAIRGNVFPPPQAEIFRNEFFRIYTGCNPKTLVVSVYCRDTQRDQIGWPVKCGREIFLLSVLGYRLKNYGNFKMICGEAKNEFPDFGFRENGEIWINHNCHPSEVPQTQDIPFGIFRVTPEDLQSSLKCPEKISQFSFETRKKSIINYVTGETSGMRDIEDERARMSAMPKYRDRQLELAKRQLRWMPTYLADVTKKIKNIEARLKDMTEEREAIGIELAIAIIPEQRRKTLEKRLACLKAACVEFSSEQERTAATLAAFERESARLKMELSV
jgi:hypothetical protein